MKTPIIVKLAAVAAVAALAGCTDLKPAGPGRFPEVASHQPAVAGCCGQVVG